VCRLGVARRTGIIIQDGDDDDDDDNNVVVFVPNRNAGGGPGNRRRSNYRCIQPAPVFRVVLSEPSAVTGDASKATAASFPHDLLSGGRRSANARQSKLRRMTQSDAITCTRRRRRRPGMFTGWLACTRPVTCTRSVAPPRSSRLRARERP